MHLSCCQGLGWWWGEGLVSFHTALPPSPTDPPFTASAPPLNSLASTTATFSAQPPPTPSMVREI